MSSIYESGLGMNAANHVPLTPISLIRRTAAVYPDRTAVIHGGIRRTWSETFERSRRLASALARHGVGRDDTVAMMAPNIPEYVEAHFGVPMAGAVLNAINTRLDAAAIAFILGHGEAKVLLTDTEYAPVIEDALAMLGKRPLVIDIDDPEGPGGKKLGQMDYEAFLASGDPAFDPILPENEWQAIALN